MQDENKENQEVDQDAIAPFLEAEDRRRSKAKKPRKNENGSRDETTDRPATDGGPLSDEELRLAISEPPTAPERQRIKAGADVLKRSFSEKSALRTPDDWERAYGLVEDDYLSGQFLIDSLGADRYMEPQLAMTILLLRQNMIEEFQIQGAMAYMLMDISLAAYYNSITLQRIHGDLVIQVQRELFHDDSISDSLKAGRTLEINKFKIEGMLNRASSSLINLINSANKMMVRNMKALQDLQSGILPIHADRKNIPQLQANHGVNGKRTLGSRNLQNSPVDDSKNP